MKNLIDQMFSNASKHVSRIQEFTREADLNESTAQIQSELGQLQTLLRWMESHVKGCFRALHSDLSRDEAYELTVMAEAMRRQGIRLSGRELWLAAKYYLHQYKEDWDWYNAPFEDEMNLPEDQFVTTVEDNIDLFVETRVLDDFE